MQGRLFCIPEMAVFIKEAHMYISPSMYSMVWPNLADNYPKQFLFSASFENIKNQKCRSSGNSILHQILVKTRKVGPLEAEKNKKVTSYIRLGGPT